MLNKLIYISLAVLCVILLLHGVPDHVYKDDANLQALWLMEEATSAPRLDYTDNDNDLANNGSVAQSATHKEGSFSADFLTGDSDFLSRAYDAVTFDNKEDFSVVFWYRVQLIDAWQRLVSYFESGGVISGFDLAFATDEKLRFQIGDNVNGVTDTCSDVLSINTWYHVAMTLDGSEGDVIVYIDGSKWGDTFASAVAKMDYVGTDPFHIGKHYSAGHYLTGLIDEVAIFDRVLSGAEIGNIHTNGIEEPEAEENAIFFGINFLMLGLLLGLRRRRQWLRSLVIILAFFMVSQVFATDYYVKNGGNDGLSGLDDTNAWETIAKVNGESFSPNDTIYFKRGSTWRGTRFTPPDSGTSGNPITFDAYGSGDLPKILGSKLVTSWTLYGGSTYWSENVNPAHSGLIGMVLIDATQDGDSFLVHNADKDNLSSGEFHYNTTDDDLYVRLGDDSNPSGHTVEIDDNIAIQLAGDDYITLRYLYIGHSNYGVQICNSGANGCIGNIVEYCTVRYTASKNIKLQGDGAAITDCIIRNNDCRYAGGSGQSHDSSEFAIHINGIDAGTTSTGNLVENNLIRDCYKGAFMLRYADSNIIRYNESHGTGESCFWLHTSDSNEIYYNILDHDGWNTSDSVFYIHTGALNNEIYNNVLNVNSATDVGLYVTGTSTGTKFKNNIYYGTARCINVAEGSHTNFESDYNCLYVTGGTFATWRGVNKTTFTNWKDDSSQDANSTDSDPSFVNRAGDDFHLQSNSPCIETGTDLSLTPDIASITVPQGNYPEMGSYEYPANVLRIRNILRIRNVLRIK